MNNEHSEHSPPISVGSSSLFAVLIMLCLTVFAVLAQLASESEWSLAQKASKSIQDYYAAEYEAAQWLSGIQSSLGTYAVDEIIRNTIEIDENRELRIILKVTTDGLFREEWAAVSKKEPTSNFETEQPAETGSSIIMF